MKPEKKNLTTENTESKFIFKNSVNSLFSITKREFSLKEIYSKETEKVRVKAQGGGMVQHRKDYLLEKQVI